MSAIQKVLGSVVAAGLVTVAFAPTAHASGTSTISGVAFEDMNRNGVFDSGDQPLSNAEVDLYDATGTSYLGMTYTDVTGHYSFGALSDGAYLVAYASAAGLEDDWVPSTINSLYPRQVVNLAGTAQLNFGWRQIVRSTDLNSPIATYRAPSGLVVESYDDAVSPESVYNTLMQGSLVGAEAATETIRFDDLPPTSSSSTTSSYQTVNGSLQTFTAATSIGWESWLFHPDQTLFHEYGEAWGEYFSYVSQQDAAMNGYLKARGLSGNPNVGTSLAWQPVEMISEDYRQLFGDPASKTAPQMNGAIPPASQVAGLAAYLSGLFRTPLAPTNLVATPGAGQVALSWTEPSTNSGMSFTISVNGTAVGTSPSASYTVRGLTDGTAYSFGVAAVWNGMTSSQSTATATSGSAGATPPPAAPVAPAVSNLAVSPQPVQSSGTVQFSLNEAATVTVTILDAKGHLVATLINAAAEPGGASASVWNRTNSSGQRVKSGTYSASVTATAGGQTTTAALPFSVK